MSAITPIPAVPFAPPARIAQAASTTAPSPLPANISQAAASDRPTPSSSNENSSRETQRETAALKAALSFKNFYAVSDQEFSIFKDITGKYITRYVSLRDGSVTYLPEPTLVRHVHPSSTPVAAQVAINA